MGQIASIIKYEGDNSTFVWKHPCEDFNSLTQLIVHESQEAIFFLNGQALDMFGAGRHTLKTQNIPKLGKYLNQATDGDTPFHCEIYFINKTVQMAVKWGTDTKIRFLEPSMGLPLEIGACGEMSLEVADSRLLLLKLVGTTSGIAWGEGGAGFTKSLQNCFKPLISTAVKAQLPTEIKAQEIDVLEIDEHLETLSEGLRKRLLPGFEEYGLTIPQFYISNLALPENDPNFRRLRELHTVSFQTRMLRAEALVKSARAEAEAGVVAAERAVALEHETTETEVTKRAAERDLIRAQTEAQAAKLAGMAEAEIMAAQGYTKRDVLTAEVQKAYAEGIGNMTISGGAASDVVGLGVGMAAAGAMAPQFGEMFKGFAPSDAREAAKCASCGAALPADARFCLACGEKVVAPGADGSVTCPSCGKTVAKGKFCPECGHKFVATCPKCGKDVSSDAKFCPECGEKL